MLQQVELTGNFQDEHAGLRLDQALAMLFSEYSRSRIKQWIEAGNVKVDNKVVTQPKFRLLGLEHVSIAAELEIVNISQPENIPLDIVYEDEFLLVINKPAGLVVHPGAGNPTGTVLNALLHYEPSIANVPRAGIVHRLDKETTGLMVVAKTIPAQTKLVEMLQARKIVREYEAIAHGHITAGGTIDEPISRHPTKRVQMAVYPLGKPAVTHYRVMELFRDYTRLRLRLETGRTHQIRVHMSYIAHPLLGDPVYAGRARMPKNASEELQNVLRAFKRQALHATILELNHPVSGELMRWHAPLPDDFAELVRVLKQDYLEHSEDYDGIYLS